MLKAPPIPTPKQGYEIILIAVVAILLRLFKLPAVSVWHNEAVSVAIAQLSWGDFVNRLLQEPFSSIYYLLLKLWTSIFGFGVHSIRGLSLVLGTLVAIAVYSFARRMFADNKIALLSGILVALSPLLIQFSQTTQGYMLSLLFAILSCIYLLHALENNTLKAWAIYTLLTIAMLSSDVLLVTVLLCQVLFVGISQKSFKLIQLLGFGLVLALSVALIWIFNSYLTTLTFAIPSFWRSMDIIWQTMFGGFGTNRMVEVIGVILALIALTFFYFKVREPKRLLITLLLPISLASGLILFPRVDSDLPVTLLLTSVMLCIYISSAILQISTRGLRQGWVIVLIIFSLFITYKNWSNLDVDTKPGMAAATTYVNDTARSQDYLFAANPRMFFSMKYYNKTNISERLFAPGHENYPGEELLTEDDTSADFSLPQSNDNAWVIWSRGFDGSKPVVPGNWELITEKFYPDAPDYKGLVVVSYYHVK